MSDLPWDPEGDGSTLLTDDDREGLRLSWVTTRGELGEAEAANIARALLRRQPTAAQLLDVTYLLRLHRAMFGDVWTWAGKTRVRLTNIGIAAPEIGPALLDLVRDVAVWLEFGTYEPDGVLARFHHRLVWIHPFPNGNGRWARAATDLLARTIGRLPFTWGAGLDLDTAGLRLAYRRALVAADRDFEDVEALIAFARN